MKALIKNKRGFAFPTVLGTFVLVTSIAAGLFIMVMNMTMMVSSEEERSGDNIDAINRVQAAVDFFYSNPNLLLNDENTTHIQERFGVGVDYTQEDDYIWKIYRQTGTNTVSAFISFNVSQGSPIVNPGTGSLEISADDPANAGSTLLNSFIHQYFESMELGAIDEEITFSTTTELLLFVKNESLTNPDISNQDTLSNYNVNSHVFINDELSSTNRSQEANIEEPYIIFIEGDLTIQMSASMEFRGNYIIGGNLTLDVTGNNTGTHHLVGTFYVQGDVIVSNNVRLGLGEIDRPTFLFVAGNINLGSQGLATGNNYAFIFANQIMQTQSGNRNVVGQIFVNENHNILNFFNITPLDLSSPIPNNNSDITYKDKFFHWALPTSIGGSVLDEEVAPIITNPQIN